MTTLDAALPNMRTSQQITSSHVAMLFDGSTVGSRKWLVSTPPSDVEAFSEKHEVMTTSGGSLRAKLLGVPCWQVSTLDVQTFKLNFDISSSVFRQPSWELCLSYDFNAAHGCL